MSFKCEITGKTSKPGEKPIRIVVKRRPREYFEERYDEDTDSYQTVKVANGWEIEKEILATENGYALWKKTQAALQDPNDKK